MSRTRHEYTLDLSRIDPAALAARGLDGVEVRAVTPADREALAALMLDAFLGTIDYEGESIHEARRDLDRFFAGQPLLGASTLACVGGTPASATLVGLWQGHVLIHLVMTAPAHKRRGLAGLVLARALAALGAEGQREVRAWITEGNTPSEAAFARLGFARRH